MGISLEILDDTDAPAIGITVDGYTNSVFSIRRTTDGGQTWRAVAGGVRVEQAGGAYVRDHFPPLNVSATYEVVVASGSTPTGTLSATITLTSEWVWIQDPLNPRSCARASLKADDPSSVGVLSGSLTTWDRPIPYRTAMVLGAREPVAAVGVRQAPVGVPLNLVVEAGYGDVLDDLMDLIDSAGVFVLRGLPVETRLDPVAYVLAPTVRPVYEVEGVMGREYVFDMTVDQVRATSAAVVIGAYTSDDVEALWGDATFDVVEEARATDTALAWEKDPTPP